LLARSNRLPRVRHVQVEARPAKDMSEAQSNDRIGVALLGMGYWGPHYARILSEMADAHLESCCDIDGRALDLARQRYPWVRCGTEPQDVIADPRISAVVIATPTRTHAELAVACLEAGKHVLVEKPLAVSVTECEQIDAARGDRVLMVGHTFVYNPAVRALRELAHSGELGDIHYVDSVRAALGPIRTDVNVLWDLGPHDIAIFLDILKGAPLEVSAVGQGYLHEDRQDVAYVNVVFSDRTLAHVHLSWLDPYKVRRITVVGDKRMVVFDDVANDERLKILDRGASYSAPAEQARGQTYGEYRAIVRDGMIVIPRIPSHEPLAEQLEDFVACIKEGRQPYSGYREGFDVVATLEAAGRSLANGGAPEKLRPAPVDS
jgi:predicted dehydrogenase